MNVCITAISTNKYNSFFNKFYESIKKYFLLNTNKTFLLFSDIDLAIHNDIKCYKIQHERWPFITLKRFHFISSIINEICKYDYFIYIDIDMYVVKNITENDFFCHNKGLFGVQHPAYNSSNGTYETNPKSTAFLDKNDIKNTYYQGCFWGGKIENIIKMVTTLKNNIDIDLSNNIIARWHDESHLNKYFSIYREDVYTYDSGYCYPECYQCYQGLSKIEPKIMHRDKSMSDFPRFEYG